MEFTDVHVNKVKIYNYLIAFHPCFNICNNAIKTMAPHGKELTAEQKEIIIHVSLSDNGYSIYNIQVVFIINSRTIQKFLKRLRERGNIENKRRSEGREKTTARDDRVLFRQIKGNRRQTLKK